MPKKEITYRNFSFVVETKDDHYGEEFWKNLEENQWEPDTLNFLNREISSGTVLFDIGAANGSISLIAAGLGAKVFAYEPNPTVFEVCKKNIELNETLKNNITLFRAAVSAFASEIKFVEGANSKIISDISIGSHSNSLAIIPVLSLSDELSKHAVNGQKNFIKMDIEGAEFSILHNYETLKSLSANRVKLLLAIHPGFYRPINKIRLLKNLRLRIFMIKNYLEALGLFDELTVFANISRTNLNPIISKKIFALLITAGYHEFIIDFDTSP